MYGQMQAVSQPEQAGFKLPKMGGMQMPMPYAQGQMPTLEEILAQRQMQQPR